jgi:hypothetical protein
MMSGVADQVVAQGHAHFAGTCGLLPIYEYADCNLFGILIGLP